MDAFLALITAVGIAATGAQARAVNISNTWVLPEEGFPVFYRYFRDRISWYEADAVCQFHHGNLVTVDTTSQFDAVRAYLKELDIISNVWIGLTRPSDKTEFAWSGERLLNGEGFWGEAAAAPGMAVCAATDPTADFRWHALTCGGPEVASFICELPVPPWATGDKGCMLTSLPSLTVIYLPEQTAVELTSDCGLDGTKRIACKGKADHEEMMRQLSCGITNEDFDEKVSPTQDVSSSKTAATKPWIWTSNTVDTSDYGSPTRHRRETEETFSGTAVVSTTDITSHAKQKFEATSSPIIETTRQKPSELLTTTKITTTDLPSVSTEDIPGEYPSINQGQLFSLIENGTLFDIIEVNDTTGDAETTAKNFTSTEKPLFTTVTYYKEATVKNYENKTSPQIPDKIHSKTVNDLTDTQNEKIFMKPSDLGSLIKLNRTNRKELPLVDYNSTEETKLPDESIKQHEHKIVEITITDIDRKNATKLYVTTKKYDKSKKEKKIDININITTQTNTTDNKQSTEEPIEPIPEVQPRPNRNRVLTRPQRRSFYPYFFSRVLG